MEEPQEMTRVSTIGDLPSFSKAPSQPMGTLSEANLRAIDHIDPAADLAHRRRNLSNVSLSSVDRAMKKLGYEAENAALTSVAVGGSSLAAAEDAAEEEDSRLNANRQNQRRGSNAAKAMEMQGIAFAAEEKKKSSMCILL